MQRTSGVACAQRRCVGRRSIRDYFTSQLRTDTQVFIPQQLAAAMTSCDASLNCTRAELGPAAQASAMHLADRRVLCGAGAHICAQSGCTGCYLSLILYIKHETSRCWDSCCMPGVNCLPSAVPACGYTSHTWGGAMPWTTLPHNRNVCRRSPIHF